MSFNFHNKTFRVVSNDGLGAEVNEATTFFFRPEGELVYADYAGGGVRLGRLVGLIEGQRLHHSYVQVNQRNEIQTGRAEVEVHLTPEGKLQLVDAWQWESQDGRGECVMEEI